MILPQKASILPESYVDRVDGPFRPGPWKTGVLARNDSPEYREAWRRRVVQGKDG
jgi:hypothetical protein